MATDLSPFPPNAVFLTPAPATFSSQLHPAVGVRSTGLQKRTAPLSPTLDGRKKRGGGDTLNKTPSIHRTLACVCLPPFPPLQPPPLPLDHFVSSQQKSMTAKSLIS
uniref:Uncharacterized protein n=1 Tax=Knipowitschia caucasica TaxID=637954 RepID=A0AAV2J6P6_KNICA